MRTPKPVASAQANVRTLPLAPAEGFLLSRVDGTLSEEDLGALTGMPDDDLRAALAKLESLGLITIEIVAPRAVSSPRIATSRLQAPKPTSSKPPRASRPPSPSPSRPPRAPQPQKQASRPARASSDAPLTYDAKELEEEVDLDAEQKKKILEFYYRLDRLDHYALLGVAKDADKKAIKRAYFEHASSFHPDKFFRKKLGNFKLKMEAVFGKMSHAHDVLTQKKTRAEYDQYLIDTQRTRGIESMLKDVLGEMAAAERAVREAVPDAPPLDIGPVGPIPKTPTPAIAFTPPGASAPAPAPPVRPRPATGSVPPAETRARREILARRLLGNRPPPARGATATSAADKSKPHANTNEAIDALKRRYEERIAQARGFQTKKYTDQAAIALAQNDPVAAANSLRVAITMSPEDPEVKRQFDEAQQAANVILAETYTRQATYEEKSENWTDAARSWTKVSVARATDANAFERAANATVRASGDLHEAARLGMRACALEPTNAKYRVTLAQVYLAAGLQLNAKRELEAAQQLAPQDDTIAALLKRVAKAT